MRALHLIIQFKQFVVAQESDFWALHLEDLRALHYTMELFKYNMDGLINLFEIYTVKYS